MYAPINCCLWYFISRAVQVDFVTDFFPPLDQSLNEKKMNEALTKCLGSDGHFSVSTWEVRDPFLGSSLVSASFPSSSPAFSDAVQIVPHDVECMVLSMVLIKLLPMQSDIVKQS